MVDLIEQSRMAVEELIDVTGRVTIEAVLNLSAQQVAGVPSQGKRRDGAVYWHGTQRGMPEMAETVGVSKSSVSRETIVAAEKELELLTQRRFDELELLIIYLDGMVFGDHHVIGAIGVDVEGRKHLLGLQEGATENA